MILKRLFFLTDETIRTQAQDTTFSITVVWSQGTFSTVLKRMILTLTHSARAEQTKTCFYSFSQNGLNWLYFFPILERTCFYKYFLSHENFHFKNWNTCKIHGSGNICLLLFVNDITIWFISINHYLFIYFQYTSRFKWETPCSLDNKSVV